MRRVRLSLVGCGLLLVCCGPLQVRMPGIAVRPNRVVVAPVATTAYELDASWNGTLQPTWGAQMVGSIVPELTKLATAAGSRVTKPEDFESCSELFDLFYAWGTAAVMEIAAQMHGRRDYGIRSVSGWRFVGDLAPLRGALDADFVMIMAFRETFETLGRVILNAGRVFTYWKQVGVACLADLRDGTMVWCVAAADRWHDLRQPVGGQHAVQELLSPIFGASLISKFGTPRPVLRRPTDR
jgi:hypothetical protein